MSILGLAWKGATLLATAVGIDELFNGGDGKKAAIAKKEEYVADPSKIVVDGQHVLGEGTKLVENVGRDGLKGALKKALDDEPAAPKVPITHRTVPDADSDQSPAPEFERKAAQPESNGNNLFASIGQYVGLPAVAALLIFWITRNKVLAGTVAAAVAGSEAYNFGITDLFNSSASDDDGPSVGQQLASSIGINGSALEPGGMQ